ncbi:hypothetical protein V8E51_003860 [Hyaloscypha variabilis]
MKTSMFVVILAAFSTTYVQATPLEDNSILERAADNLPGLNAVQTKHANQIIGEAKKANSGLRILANPKAKTSFNYPNDGTGQDHDSIGIFQQRFIDYKNIACDMDAACSAGQFFVRMQKIRGWRTMDVAKLCQAVQISEFRMRMKWTALATEICKAFKE